MVDSAGKFPEWILSEVVVEPFRGNLFQGGLVITVSLGEGPAS